MSKTKHGLIGSTIKIVMVIAFAIIGACVLSLGAVFWAKGYDQGTDYNIRWLSICNVVFGACLLTSPFFLSKNRSGLNSIIKIAMVIIFTAIGAALITIGAIPLANHTVEQKDSWIMICNIVFGACLLTSPFFLKKSLMGSKEK